MGKHANGALSDLRADVKMHLSYFGWLPGKWTKIRASVFLILCFAAYCPSAVKASTLNDAAITVRYPTNALLISVAIAGTRIVAVGAHGLIIYSDDNGQSWHQSSVPTSETITCLAFATPNDGWAAGGQGVVLHTSDGGLTWQRQFSGAQVLPLMQAAAIKLATADPSSAAAQLAVRRANIFMNAGPDKPFLTILPFSPNAALIFGAYRMAILTTDGGKTWADWSLHIGDPISHNIYDVVRSGSSVYLAGEAGTVLRATNLDKSPALDFSMATAPSPGTLLGILSTRTNTLIAFGVAGEVFRSTDSGQTWTRSNISVGTDLPGGTILSSGIIVVVSEDGGVYDSDDDGVSFQRLPMNQDMALFDVAQASNGNVVLVGSGGVRILPGIDFK
ncbi:MAG: hypothetical protein POH28_02335 [Acidocella sp.]|nr:hypothetical protein [Acidocella sp.]